MSQYVNNADVVIKDPEALARTCERLGLAAPQQGTAVIWGIERPGTLVNIPGYDWPVVIDADGNVGHDLHQRDFSWASPTQYDQFIQTYAIECAKGQFEAQGFSVTETLLEDGSISLEAIDQGAW